jgi:hypothetical protein
VWSLTSSLAATGTAASQLIVVQDWLGELERRASVE